MARTSKRPKIELTEDQKQELEKISRSRTAVTSYTPSANKKTSVKHRYFSQMF